MRSQWMRFGLICAALLAAPRPGHAQIFASPLDARNGFFQDGGANLALYDLNGDGIPDLVTGVAGYPYSYRNIQGGITVQYGNGDGTFRMGSAIYMGYVPSYIISPMNLSIGDFDGDGRPDILAPLSEASGKNGFSPAFTLDVFSNSAAFDPPRQYTVPVNPTAAVMADVNGDGIADVLLTSSGNLLTVYLGAGGGLYGSGAAYQVGTNDGSEYYGGVNPTTILTGDLNGDGALDIVTVNKGDGTLSVLLNNGDGTFANAVAYPVGSGLADAQIGDLNGDGSLDIAVLQNGMLRMLLNDTYGAFVPGGNAVPVVGFNTTTFLLGDFDRDGVLDAIDNQANVYLHFGTAPAAVPTPVVAGSGNLAVGDLNNDGWLDVVVNNQVYLNLGGIFFLSGTVTLEGISALATPQTVTLTFRDQSGATKFTLSRVLNSDGTFSLSYPVAGDYVVHITCAHYLAANVTLHAPPDTIQTLNVTLHPGDANGDNVVDLADFGALINAYGGNKYDSTSGYDANADFNGDGNDDIADFALLIANFGAQGDL